MTTVYDLVDVSFRYSSDPVIDNVTFAIEAGDYVGIIGENGGGKTTLLRLLTGEKKPLSGSLRFFGKDGITKDNILRLGYVPQTNPASRSSFPIHCEELVALGLAHKLKHRPYLKPEEKEAVNDSLAHLGVLDLAKKNFHELSGGQKQRVLIAKALVNNPDVLIFDEPTVGIDEKNKANFFHILDHMNQVHGITIIMVTHETGLGAAHWNRTFRIEGHRVEEVC